MRVRLVWSANGGIQTPLSHTFIVCDGLLQAQFFFPKDGKAGTKTKAHIVVPLSGMLWYVRVRCKLLTTVHTASYLQTKTRS